MEENGPCEDERKQNGFESTNDSNMVRNFQTYLHLHEYEYEISPLEFQDFCKRTVSIQINK